MPLRGSGSSLCTHHNKRLMQLLPPGYSRLSVTAVNPDQDILECSTAAGLDACLLIVWLCCFEYALERHAQISRTQST